MTSLKTLALSSGFHLPLAAVTQTIAILAKRRSGKSYLAMKFVEQLLRAHQQVVVLDPKGDSWGLRFGVDGQSAGLPIVIIGGEHGDVKLEANAGEVIARLIVEDRICAVLDLSELRKHEVATFSAAFLETVYRLKAQEKYRTPVMLVIDEADAIAPQRPQRGEERMLGAAEDIVRRGGQRGIGCMMATQRAAVLNKNVLTQSQIMIALRTIAPQDLAAMNAWIDVHGTAEQKKELMGSLPSLPTGTAWIWSPGWPTTQGIFTKVAIGKRETFDSGATPETGDRPLELRNPAEVDLTALSEKMKATIERAKADDPKLLKKRISELETELKKKAPTTTVTERVEVEVVKPVFDKAAFNETTRQIKTAIDKAKGDLQAACAEALQAYQAAMETTSQIPRSTPVQRPAVRPVQPQPTIQSRESARIVGNGNAALNSGQRRILTVLAQNGGAATKRKVALIAGYAVSGGGFNNNLSSLRTHGLISGSNELTLTPEGAIVLGDYEELPAGSDALQHWVSTLGKAAGTILTVLSDSDGELDKERLAEIAGYAVDGGGFNNTLSKLRTLELISGSRTLRLSDDLR